MVDSTERFRHLLDRGRKGDWEGVAEELREALESAPGDPALLCWLGVVEREMGVPGSGYDLFKEALAQAPRDPLILATIGNGLAQLDDPDAEAALRSAAVMAPDLVLARTLYGAYLSREGLHEDAIRELDAASALDPDDSFVAYERGVALALQGRMVEALDALSRSVELEPEEGWVRVVKGLVEVTLDRLEDAARDLAEGARERPEDVEAQVLAALAAGAVPREDLAWEMLERGRQNADPLEVPFLEQVEMRLDEGPESARAFLVQEVVPGAMRERLMTRP
jgi:tetratricopeptide (TPR) repeat protein